MSDLKKTLKQIRPNLKDIAPLTYSIIVLFVVFNLLLALTYPFILSKIPSLQRVAYIPIRLWVIFFAIYGLILLYHLLQNDWKRCKQTLIVGIGMKGSWLYQLISIGIITNSRFVWFSVIIWTFLTSLKFFTYMYFTPMMGESREDD